VRVTFGFAGLIRKLHNGSYSMYLVWSLLGLALVTIFLIFSI